MGLWPGEGHFARRYDYGTEYARIMRELRLTAILTAHIASSFRGILTRL